MTGLDIELFKSNTECISDLLAGGLTQPPGTFLGGIGSLADSHDVGNFLLRFIQMFTPGAHRRIALVKDKVNNFAGDCILEIDSGVLYKAGVLLIGDDHKGRFALRTFDDLNISMFFLSMFFRHVFPLFSIEMMLTTPTKLKNIR